MAKNLLWLFVVVNLLSSVLTHFAGEETTFANVWPMWTAVGVLALCESIEKIKAA